MTVLGFTLLLMTLAFASGVFGSMTGLGGGVILVPILVLLFGVDMPYAIGASLVCVLATSTGAASSFLREGLANLRLAVLLELATTPGALVGAVLVSQGLVPSQALKIIFGLILLVSGVLAGRTRGEKNRPRTPDPLATRLQLDGTFPTQDGSHSYLVQRVPQGMGLMTLAGFLSGLLGIGSGSLNVLALDQTMRVPFKVASATSNLMIGVTAAASAGIYLHHGYIDPALALPVVLGVLAGSLVGARLLPRVRTIFLRRIFSVVVLFLAVQMIYRGIRGLWV